jgi:hypothetical protein
MSTEELIKQLLRDAKPIWVKPADVLLIGNVQLGHEQYEAIAEVLEQLKKDCGARKVYVFEGGIDVRLIPEEALNKIELTVGPQADTYDGNLERS